MAKGKTEDIKKYWNNQARLARSATSGELRLIDEEKDIFASSSPAVGGTLKDPVLRELEIEALSTYIRTGDTILDVGCGNGYTVLEICRRIPGARAVGIDYSAEMIRNALELRDAGYPRLRTRVDFRVGDMLRLEESAAKKFSVVITVRTLMNLVTWKAQKAAITEIHTILKRGGTYLMLEANVESTKRLNEVRARLGLSPFGSGNWHNLFISDKKLLPFAEPLFTLKSIDHHASTYMLITRALMHTVDTAGRRYDYGSAIHAYAGLLPNHGEYGIHNLHVFRKR
jgi:ubiquinone/menaquinone biosynthesis C-methylase UbiE